MKLISKHCYVLGIVQGVFYRKQTEKKAKSLKVTGWIKNLSDGRVEAIISGEEKVINDMLKWMQFEVKNASVIDIEVFEVQYNRFDTFEIVD